MITYPDLSVSTTLWMWMFRCVLLKRSYSWNETTVLFYTDKAKHEHIEKRKNSLDVAIYLYEAPVINDILSSVHLRNLE